MFRLVPAVVAALLLGACTPEADSELDQVMAAAAATTEAEPAEPGARRNLVLTATPLVPGDTFTLTVTGANPNEQVNIARSPQGLGTGPCFGTASLLCLDIRNPSLQGQAITDVNGVARLTQTLPNSLTIGTDVWFQAVVPRGASGAAWLKSTATQVFIEDADLPVADMVAGDLILTEIMQNPAAVADGSGEWFEVLNTTDLDMNLAGLVVTDFQGDTFTVADNLFLAAGQRLVFGRNATLATNGAVPVDYEYTGMDLGNGSDEIHLLGDVSILDSVAWDDGQSFPDPSGASMELEWQHQDHLSNDVGVNWREATAPYGFGDRGTPGVGAADPGRWFYTINHLTDSLERVDLDTMTWESVGPLGTSANYGDLAYDVSSDTLYMIDGLDHDNLWTVDRTTGAATLIGAHGVDDLFGLVYDPRTDTLYAGASTSNRGLYVLDVATAAATFVGDPVEPLDGLTYDPVRDRLVAITAGPGDLYELDPLTATLTLLSDQPFVNNCGLGYDPVTDQYWVLDLSRDLYSYDPAAGYTQVFVDTSPSEYTGFEHVPYAD